MTGAVTRHYSGIAGRKTHVEVLKDLRPITISGLALPVQTSGLGCSLKRSAVGLGFNEAETNCRIAHILGILLMISYSFALYFSDIIVVSVQFQFARSISLFLSSTCDKSKALFTRSRNNPRSRDNPSRRVISGANSQHH